MDKKAAIIEKIKKMQALATRGVQGEAQNAAMFIDNLMKKYGIRNSDLQTDSEDIYWLRYKNDYEYRLLFQIAFSMEIETVSDPPRRKEIGIKLTKAKYLELKASYEFYRQALSEELDRFYTAFVNLYRIFPPNVKTIRASKEEALKFDLLMRGINKKERLIMIEGASHV